MFRRDIRLIKFVVMQLLPVRCIRSERARSMLVVDPRYRFESGRGVTFGGHDRRSRSLQAFSDVPSRPRLVTLRTGEAERTAPTVSQVVVPHACYLYLEQ